MLKQTRYIILALTLVAVLLAGCSSQTAMPAQQPTTAADQQPITPTPASSSDLSPDQPSDLPDRVDVVYFQRGQPCHCMAVIGENIQSIVLHDFLDEYAAGKLTFTLLDSTDEANYEMAMKYKTGPFGLFITIVEGETEKIVPVEELWSMTGDEEKYKAYVKDIIAKSLKGEL